MTTTAPAASTPTQPDDTAPSGERQAELHAARDANLKAGKPPYANVQLRSRGELKWVLAEEGWDGEHDAYTVKYVLTPQGIEKPAADLREVNLGHVSLGEVFLRRANLAGANLVFADLRGAHLADASLCDGDMGRVNLWHAELNYANLAGVHMREANLAGANLQYTNLAGARFHTADMRGTILHGSHMDARTILSGVRFDAHTWLGDVGWNGAALARIDWSPVTQIGDEGTPLAGKSRTIPVTLPGDAATAEAERSQRATHPQRRGWREGGSSYRDAARAYQQLSLALQSQGMGEPAARFAYRAQVLQRKALWREGKLGRWFFSMALSTLAGYGYRMGRILTAYAVVVLLAALAYWLLGTQGQGPALQPQDAFLVSVTAFHGRVFSEGFRLGGPDSWVAAAEAVMGLVIEGVFIAMLTQRFFSR